MNPGEIRDRVLTPQELLTGIFNEQHEQLLRNRVDNRTMQRTLVAGVMPKQETEREMARAQKMIKVKETTMEVIEDELRMLKEQEDKSIANPTQ